MPDKEAVLLALIEQQTEDYLTRLRAALSAVSNPVDGLLDVAGVFGR